MKIYFTLKNHASPHSIRSIQWSGKKLQIGRRNRAVIYEGADHQARIKDLTGGRYALVNGASVEDAPLKEGDELQLGSFTVQIKRLAIG